MGNKIRRMAWSAALLVLGHLWVCGALEAVPLIPDTGRSRVILAEDQAEIVEQLKPLLPEGWVISSATLDQTPSDWLTLDGGGVHVHFKKEFLKFDIWLLPQDWIGIRKFDENRPEGNPWQRALIWKRYKIITITNEEPMYGAICKLGVSDSSPIRGDRARAEEVFKDRMEEADRKARQLVDLYCKHQPSRDEAARSLLTLGIPAKSVFARTAVEAQGQAQEFWISTLERLGGKDSVVALSQILLDPRSSPTCQKFAAMSLQDLADPDCGPTLLKALDRVTDGEVAAQVAAALERIRYKPAAPKLLERMHRESNYQTYYAKALASLRYSESAPSIRKLCKVEKLTSDWAMEAWGNDLARYPELALLRLEGPWGEPADGVRLLLLSPDKPKVGSPIHLALLVENVSDEDLRITKYVVGKAMINARLHDVGPGIWDGNSTLRVNGVWVYSFDLSTFITKPGKYQIKYEVGKAASNEITLEVAGGCSAELGKHHISPRVR